MLGQGAAPELTEEEEAGIPDEAADDTEDKGIEGFWLQAFGNLPEISEFIQEEDVPLLLKLEDITCTYNDEYTSFTITFFFKENDYMTQTVLTKKYTVDPHLFTDEGMSNVPISMLHVYVYVSVRLCGSCL